MKLQLALDLVNIPQAIELVKEVEEHIDIVELGTPVINKEGLKAVEEMKAAFHVRSCNPVTAINALLLQINGLGEEINVDILLLIDFLV